MARTIAEYRNTAALVLADYCNPAKYFAFNTYDRVSHDGPLTPEDVLMANLLSLRLTWSEVIPLFAAGTDPPQILRQRLDDALGDLRAAPRFEDHDSVQALENTLTSLATANVATEPVRGWTAVTVSKVLHRRRPHIVPLLDSRVRAFYATKPPAAVRAALWVDIIGNRDWLQETASAFTRPDGAPMSLLRAADILIWHGDTATVS